MTDENQDAILFCLEALQSATDRESAMEQAKIAHQQWLRVYTPEEDFSMDELKELLNIRSSVFAIIAAVYVWNGEYELAYDIENEFLMKQKLWEGKGRGELEMYLMQLLVFKQTDRLKKAFSNVEFRNAFLTFEDIYLTLLNPYYEFKSHVGIFVNLLNQVNNYSRMLTGSKLI
jgi:hypothetical protein